MIEHKNVSLQSVRLHYVEMQGPEPALVLLHGLASSSESYLHVIPDLAATAHVYALDNRGHGQSGHTPGEYRTRHFASDIIEFLRTVVGRPAVLAAHSGGVAIPAAWAAVQEPHRVRGLLVEDGNLSVRPGWKGGPYYTQMRDALASYREAGQSVEDLARAIGQLSPRGRATQLELLGPEGVRLQARQWSRMDPTALEPVFDGTAVEDYDPEEVLPAIECPVHLVFSRVGEETAQRIASLIPRCTYALVDTDAHEVRLAEPGAYVREMKRFLQALAD